MAGARRQRRPELEAAAQTGERAAGDANPDVAPLPMPSPPGIERVGADMDTAERRQEWLRLVLAAHEASRPGGPLEGYVFHGASLAQAEGIRAEGVWATPVLMRDYPDGPDEDAETWWTTGTYWATAWIAAFYAEDRIHSRPDPALPLALVAARLEDLESEAPFTADEQSVDSPIDTRLGKSIDELAAEWDASGMDWEDSIRIFGSFVCLGPVGPEHVHVVASMDDLQDLVEHAAARPSSLLGPA